MTSAPDAQPRSPNGPGGDQGAFAARARGRETCGFRPENLEFLTHRPTAARVAEDSAQTRALEEGFLSAMDTDHSNALANLAARMRDDYGGCRVHPVAALFPALGSEEFAELVADIKAHGQHQPIVLTADGTTIVDGINRYKACRAAGVKPKTRNLPKSYDEARTIRFIMSANMRRRDLSSGQKVMIGLEIEPFRTAAAKELQIAAGSRGKEGGRGKRKTLVPMLGQGKGKRGRPGLSIRSPRRPASPTAT